MRGLGHGGLLIEGGACEYAECAVITIAHSFYNLVHSPSRVEFLWGNNGRGLCHGGLLIGGGACEYAKYGVFRVEFL